MIVTETSGYASNKRRHPAPTELVSVDLGFCTTRRFTRILIRRSAEARFHRDKLGGAVV